MSKKGKKTVAVRLPDGKEYRVRVADGERAFLVSPPRRLTAQGDGRRDMVRQSEIATIVAFCELVNGMPDAALRARLWEIEEAWERVVFNRMLAGADLEAGRYEIAPDYGCTGTDACLWSSRTLLIYDRDAGESFDPATDFYTPFNPMWPSHRRRLIEELTRTYPEVSAEHVELAIDAALVQCRPFADTEAARGPEELKRQAEAFAKEYGPRP